MESTFQKISRKTGNKQSFCKCTVCKSQCERTPCLPTPEDVDKLIAAGYADRLAPTLWAAGIMMGVTDQVVNMIAPKYDNAKGACTFFNNGLCELHVYGLKPTEGKLSDHQISRTNTNPQYNIAWHVAKEWWGKSEGEIESILKPVSHEL